MYNQSKLKLRCCENCKTFCYGEFKQVVNLKSSGLIIYIHEDDTLQTKNVNENNKSIILHNTGNKELNRFDYISELCRYKTKCIKCTTLIQGIRSLLEDMSIINNNKILGICEYCKRSNKRNKCDRCEYIVNKFIKNKVQQERDREEHFRMWIAKVKEILLSIMQGQVICKHNICLDSESKMQLDRLLKCLHQPAASNEQKIGNFSNITIPEYTINESNKFLNDLICKLNSNEMEVIATKRDSGDLIFESESMCICKYLNKKKNDENNTPFLKTLSNEKVPPKQVPSNEEVTLNILLAKDDDQKNAINIKINGENTNKKLSQDVDKQKQVEKKVNINKIKGKENIDENAIMKSSKIRDKRSPQGGKGNKGNSNYDIMLKMLKERQKEKRNPEKLVKNEKIKDIPQISDLPIIKVKKKSKIYKIESESFVECIDKRKVYVNKMIKGNDIVPYDARHTKTDKFKVPMLYKIHVDCIDPEQNANEALIEIQEPNKIKMKRSRIDASLQVNSGVIFYQLSNREFIEKGWTELPTIKIMRRMNIYKMLPSKDQFDWFKNHMEQKILFYDGGEKLAEIFENGCGKWFYRNGEIALDYYNTKDINNNKRYIIYSSSEDTTINKKSAITVLACFDYLGNGIVYDHCGAPRLKYNQSEGLVMDKKIGPPCRWKWHTLNDPPVIQQVYLNTQEKGDTCLKQVQKNDEDIKKTNEDMITIELENFVKEKATKMLQKFTPFEIRTKVLKINNNFSLRIINQSNICLNFRCGHICLKQNIGMILKSDEIIDTDVVDLADVSTPYDRVLPKSPSLERIQNIIFRNKLDPLCNQQLT